MWSVEYCISAGSSSCLTSFHAIFELKSQIEYFSDWNNFWNRKLYSLFLWSTADSILPQEGRWSHPNGLQRCADRTDGNGFQPQNLHKCLWTHDLQVHRLKMLSRHADLYTVSRCHTRGKPEDHTGEKACKGSTLVLKPSRNHQKSKPGMSVAPEKDVCPPIFFFYQCRGSEIPLVRRVVGSGLCILWLIRIFSSFHLHTNRYVQHPLVWK